LHLCRNQSGSTHRGLGDEEYARRIATEISPSAQREDAVYRVTGKIVTGPDFHGICMRFSEEETTRGQKRCSAALDIEFNRLCDGMFVELEGVPDNASTIYGNLSVLMVTWVHESVSLENRSMARAK
jgi:hypothetical protein